MEIKIDVKIEDRESLRNRMSLCEVTVPDLKARQYLYLPYDDFYPYLSELESRASDLLFVAGNCYVVDQMVPRTAFADNWTRDLDVTIPVEEPQLWGQISAPLSEMLTFLTGDNWAFSFQQRRGQLFRSRRTRRRYHSRPHLGADPASAICLFSGGLDSLVGALQYLDETDSSLILIGHYDLGSIAKNAQARLAEKIRNIYSPTRFRLIQARVGPIQSRRWGTKFYTQVSGPGKETTLRSRSFVFLALALCLAQQTDNREFPILIPENGFIALNPPLTSSRLSSCSTRTVHPLFLVQLQPIIEKLGLKNPIKNPFAAKTKGEILSHSLNLNLIKELVPETVSCAHPTRRQGWIRRYVTHCGYCIPCIFRRAALHQVGLDQGEMYGYDICTGELELNAAIASDLRAALSWIYEIRSEELTLEDLAKQMTLPPDEYSIAVRVLQAGVDELTRFFRDKAVLHIRQWAGLEE